MSDARKYAAWLFIIPYFGVSRLDAGSMAPYQTVLSVSRQSALVIVDMETGTHTEVPVEGLGLPRGGQSIAVDADGRIYVYVDDFFQFLPDGQPFRGTYLARLDPTTSQWMTMIIDGSITGPTDMDVKPDGNLIVAGEFDVFDIDLTAKTARPSGVRRSGDIGEGKTIAVEIDSSGTIVTGAFSLAAGSVTTPLFRQTEDEDVAERFDTEIQLSHFVLDSDGTVIGVRSLDRNSNRTDTGTLYRLDFDTKSVEVLFESELLFGASEIELDPAGRIVSLSLSDDFEPRIVRVDLELGAAEIVADLSGYLLADMDLRVIPEPPGLTLLSLGSFAWLVFFGSRERFSLRQI